MLFHVTDLVTVSRVRFPVLSRLPCEESTSSRCETIVPRSRIPVKGNVLLPGTRVTSVRVAFPITRSPLFTSRTMVPTSSVSTEGLGRVALPTRLVPSDRRATRPLSEILNPVNLFSAKNY